jgi:hypothetical protein
MKNDLTIFHDASGNPTQVLMSWVEYQKLLSGKPKLDGEALQLNSNEISLPGAGNFAVNVDELVHLLKNNGVSIVPICARAKKLTEFEEHEKASLEYIIRSVLLGPESPYHNTMQCTALVVEALVHSGRFERCKDKGPRYFDGRPFVETYYRAVMCLKIKD